MTLRRVYQFYRIVPIMALLIAAGCSSDDGTGPNVIPPEPVPPGVYIINEGNYGAGNSSLSYFLPDSTRIINNVFKTKTGMDLGDTGYSMTYVAEDNLLYIVVNNSDKIEVISTIDQTHVHTIELDAGASPRWIGFGPDGLGYITHMNGKSISVYDPTTKSIIRTLAVGNNPEEIYYAQNHLYCANSGFGTSQTITVFELSTLTVTQTLVVGDGPTEFARISAGRAAVLCTGDYGDYNDPNDDTPGSIFIIRTGSGNAEVIDSVTVGDHPTSITIDGQGNLYVNCEHSIAKVNAFDLSVQKNFISGTFYALQYDVGRDRLYATDVKDYQQPGEVYVYSSKGSLLNKYTTGVIPGKMVIVD